MSLTKVTRSMIDDSVFNVKDYGAVGDGVANDRLAIKAAIDAADANGGGTVLFPAGTYLVSGFQTSVNIPEIDNTLQYANSSYEAQVYVQNVDNLNFKFDGSVLQSNKTDGGITLLFDGCSNISFENLRMIGATVMTGTTATVTGTTGIAFVSLTQDSRNITLTNTRITNHYSSLDIAGNPAASTKVVNVTLAGSTYFATGYYGLACRGNGQSVVVQNMYNYQMNRAFFIYDTKDVSVSGIVDFLPTSGFSPLVKCYTTNTRNIKLNCVFKNKANLVTPRLSFQSQHNPALQATPAFLQDIFVNYTEESCGSGGIGIEFDYYQNSTLTTSTNGVIFSRFTFVGQSSNTLDTTVELTSVNNVCLANVDNFVASNGKEILNDTGFVGASQFTYNPELKFGGADTGITYASRSGKYYIQGGFCTVIGSFVLSSKGSATGAAQIIMPVLTREDSSNLPLVSVIGVADMSSLSGSVFGYIQASSSNVAVLFSQGATAITAVTNANFTDDSEIIFQATYPI